MPCVEIKIGDMTALVCGVPKRKAKTCFYCGDTSGFLCDFPIKVSRNGKKKTCDRALCAGCAKHGLSPDVDFCGSHYPLAKAAYERRNQIH